MHNTSYREMKRQFQERFYNAKESKSVLDVGSCSFGGKIYKSLMLPGWSYTGCDISSGTNVDLVMTGPVTIPVEDNYFDIVISGQCFEHTERPWLLIKEVSRVLKVGGWMFITAPFKWHIHKYPIDCWRFLPDGMKILFNDAGLNCILSYVLYSDCWAIGVKK